MGWNPGGGRLAKVVSPLAVAGACAAAAMLPVGPAGAASSVRGVTPTSITIGGLGQAQVYVGMATGAKARFAQINKAGGINGRKIKYVGLKDDGSNAQTNLSETQALVQQTKVFALAPVTSADFLPQSSNYLKQNQVPFVGWGWMPGFCGNAYGYGFNGCLIGTSESNSSSVDPVLKALKQQTNMAASKVRVAIQTSNTVTNISGAKQYAQIFKLRGAKVVYNEANLPANSTTTDYSPFIQAVLAAKPNVVYAAGSFTQVIGMTSALRQGGFTGPVVNFVTYVPGLLSSTSQTAQALQGVWVNSQLPPVESNAAAVKQMKAGLRLIGKSTNISQGEEVGYFSADVLAQQLKAAGKNLTPASFQKAMKSFTYKGLAGGLGPVSFPADKTGPTPCSSVVKVTGTQYKVLVPMSCYQDIKAT